MSKAKVMFKVRVRSMGRYRGGVRVGVWCTFWVK